MSNNYNDDYIEGSIFDLDDEWKPIGLVPKHRSRNNNVKIIIFCACIGTFAYILYSTLHDLYKDDAK